MRMTDVITVLRANAPDAEVALMTMSNDLTSLMRLADDFATVESEGAKKAIASAIGDAIRNLQLDLGALREPIGSIVTANTAYKRQFGKPKHGVVDAPGQMELEGFENGQDSVED